MTILVTKKQIWGALAFGLLMLLIFAPGAVGFVLLGPLLFAALAGSGFLIWKYHSRLQGMGGAFGFIGTYWGYILTGICMLTAPLVLYAAYTDLRFLLQIIGIIALGRLLYAITQPPHMTWKGLLGIVAALGIITIPAVWDWGKNDIILPTANAIESNIAITPINNTVIGNPTPVVMTPQPYLAPNVEIPECSEGWSEVIDTPAGYGYTWGWAVVAQLSNDGDSFETYVNDTSPNADMFQFCSNKPGYVDRRMPLTWRVL